MDSSPLSERPRRNLETVWISECLLYWVILKVVKAVVLGCNTCKTVDYFVERTYDLRPRPHEYQLPERDDRNFINRVLLRLLRSEP